MRDIVNLPNPLATEQYTLSHRARANLPLLAFFGVALLTLWPILSHLHLPLTDLPNHIARHHILSEGAAGPLAEYYSARLAIVPNAAADFLWYLAAGRIDPVRFSQWVMAFYAVNLITAAMVLSRALHGRWSLWPLAAALLVFNGNYFWGFQNFLTAAPFVIWGLALWLVMEDRGLRLRLPIFALYAMAMFVMHFFAFAILAFAVAGREVQRVIEAAPRQSGRQLASRATMGLPFVLPVIWLAWGVLTSGPSIQGNWTTWPSWSTIILGIGSITEQTPAPSVAFNVSGLVILALMAFAFRTMRFSIGPRLVFAPQMRGPILALLLAGLCAPFWLNGVAFVHIRIPFLLVVLTIAATRWEGCSPMAGRLIALTVVSLVSLRAVQVEGITARHDAETRDFLATIATLPEGARLLPLRGPGMEADVRLSHLQAYAVPTRNAYVPTLFQGVHLLELHEEWRDIAHPQWAAIDIRWALDPTRDAGIHAQPQFWRDWTAQFTHAVLFDEVEPAMLARLPLTEIARQGRFTLYAVTGTTISPATNPHEGT